MPHPGSRKQHLCRRYLTLLVLAAGLVIGQRAYARTLPPAPAYNPPQTQNRETAILSGGCFWGMQGVFEHVKGVIWVAAGYTGGSAATAHYADVSTGRTGHAESIKIRFDPRRVSYGTLLRIYVSITTDPTTLNRQGPDIGPQYRSQIWTTSPAQQRIARLYLGQLTQAHSFARPIVTKITPAMPFYLAERHHQDFMVRHPDDPYILINDQPKRHALARDFPALYRATPVLLPPALVHESPP